MAVEYSKARGDVVALVQAVIEQHHPDLAGARIGVLMRETAPKVGGIRRIYGKARKVSAEQYPFMPYDFVIWFAEDVWAELNGLQRRALVDHELCHCTVTPEEEARIQRHDMEEFYVIIERYGFWWPFAQEAEQVFQARLGLEGTAGAVEAIDPAQMDLDVQEQVDGLFDATIVEE
jgi:hypothetical protein